MTHDFTKGYMKLEKQLEPVLVRLLIHTQVAAHFCRRDAQESLTYFPHQYTFSNATDGGIARHLT